MNETLRRYRQVDYRLPKTYLAWDLFGAGLDHLGRGGKPVEHPLRDPAPDEILLRVDAIGLCFSDAKLVWAGNEHPRIRGRDLAGDPTVPGHEAALTVVKAGSNWKDRFAIGQRFIIQADLFVGGRQRAFGYVHRGALAQFTYAGPDILAGDDGCYLLPIAEKTGYAEAALVEPWACVEHAYHLKARVAAKPGGRALAIDSGDNNRADIDRLYADGAGPALLVLLGRPAGDWNALGAGRIEEISARVSPEAVARLSAEFTEGAGFDDIYLLGPADAGLVAACDAALAKGGCLVFAGTGAAAAAIDIGRAHYHDTRHIGAADGRLARAYTANTREELAAGGLCWMAGAAGPMGQMHVQRALELEAPPQMVYCTDLSSERLAYMQTRLEPLARRAGVDLRCVNSRDVPDLDAALRDVTSGRGFDDVYVHAPVAKVVEQCARHIAPEGVLNIFAGVALGTLATVSPDLFAAGHARMIGSSGSSMDDIRGVLAKVEAGRLATRMSLAALGGVEAGWQGLKGVKENAFLGKTVLFPAARDVPLLTADRLAEVSPGAAAALESGSVWTNGAEDILLSERLVLD